MKRFCMTDSCAIAAIDKGKEVAKYEGMIRTFEHAHGKGAATLIYDCEHIDYALVTTAREIVALAKSMERAG